MPIPDFQTLMRPLLQHLSDGSDHANQETFAFLGDMFHLSQEERNRLMPGGKFSFFGIRISWAKARLKQAGLIDSPRPGMYRITANGAAFLRETTGPITLKDLNLGKHPETESAEEPVSSTMTPEEQIEYAHKQIRQKLAIDLLDRIKSCPPSFFEQLVVDLIVAMRYGGLERDAGRAVGQPGDGGIDGIVKQDQLGLDAIYIQAKRWEGTVGRPEIQKFAGALQGRKARKGIFVTTSSFTKEAQEYATSIDSKIILIDGKQLAELLIDNGVGVTEQVHGIKKLDSNYFVTQED